MSAEPAGLYLHVPFCSAICPYCDFAVLVGGRVKRERFVDTLLLEIERHVGSSFAPIDTIYFGGGTPSLLEPEDLERILDAVKRVFAPAPGTRIFLEANPEDVDTTRLEAWRQLGVTTLSLGVQSFEDDELRFLGRRHRGAEARRAVELAKVAGFATVSVDLIFGLPDQTTAAWKRQLEAVIDLGADHLSCYELEIHLRTTFGKQHERGEIDLLGEAQQADLFLLTHRVLAAAGYDGYEVSNFARSKSHRSLHNSKYWRHVSYLGLGPSAHSFDGYKRWWNERHLARWEKLLRDGASGSVHSEELTDTDLALETLMLGLRTKAGVDLRRFAERFGYALEERNAALLESLTSDGLLLHDAGWLRPTLEGFAVADGLASAFELG